MTYYDQRLFDIVIIGSGTSGLVNALQLSYGLKIAIISKDTILEGSSFYAQGGISAVLTSKDSFDKHITDTINVAQGLASKKAVSFMVKKAPSAIKLLEKNGVVFTQQNSKYHLTTEGGHSKRRVAHVADKTGVAIQTNLADKVKSKANITIFEHHIALDLLVKDNNCYGAFVLDKKTDTVYRFFAKHTVLATGGASKIYFYTSNPDTSTGDGIAMAYRAGCSIVDMEFTQFHPTCLYHPKARSFLISEALRGEGAKLLLPNGKQFMDKYHAKAELASRDIVAMAIDSEMKIHGINYVYLDISFRSKKWLIKRFPTIYAKCIQYGIDISSEPIPVVPSAHYSCGGVKTDLHTKTTCNNLYAIGEVASTNVHGANRMASNSLLECMVFALSCAKYINNKDTLPTYNNYFPPWDTSLVKPASEKIIVSHLWDEIRIMMWNFVGIVRSNDRLLHAKRHLDIITKEVDLYYKSYIISSDLIELRNLVEVANITVKSAIIRKESRGLHYNVDYPEKLRVAKHTTIIKTS